MKMYEANYLSIDVREIEATKVTDARVYYKKANGQETWSATASQYTSYHKTEKEAWEEIERLLLSKVEDAKSSVRHHEHRLNKLRDKMNQP